MDNFFDKFRSGAEKAAFEADKLRRVTAVQSTVRSLKGDFEKEFYQVGRVAYMLHQKQQISQPELQEACNRLMTIQSQIQAREREVEQIRAETYETGASIGQTRYGHLCPNGHGPIPPQDSFCQKCGARAIEVPPPTGRQCPHCGAALAAEARFCASCGQAAPPVPLSPPLVENQCPACGTALLPGALFCAECGHHLKASEPTLPPVMGSTKEMLTSVDPFLEPDESEPVNVVRTELFMDFGDFDFSAVGEEENEENATVAERQLTEEAASVIEEDVEVETPVLQQEVHVVTEPTSDPKEAAESVVKEKVDLCPICQTALLPDAVFCAECGHRLIG